MGWSPAAKTRRQTDFLSHVATDVQELKERGVVFEEYDFLAFKTVDSIGTSRGIGKSAWFQDPDRNTIALFQPE